MRHEWTFGTRLEKIFEIQITDNLFVRRNVAVPGY